MKYEVWWIVVMNKDLFNTKGVNKQVPTILIVGRFVGTRSEMERKTWKTRLIDFTCDGGVKKPEGLIYNDLKDYERRLSELMLKGKCLDVMNREHGTECKSLMKGSVGEEFDGLWKEEVLDVNKSWIMRKEKPLTKKTFREYYLRDSMKKMIRGMKEKLDKVIEDMDDESCVNDEREIEWRTVNVMDIFDMLTIKSNSVDIKDAKDDVYKYPVISQAEFNDGIGGWSKEFGYDATIEPVICVVGINGVCHVQYGKFITYDVHIMCLQLKNKDWLKYIDDISLILSHNLKGKCEYNNKMNRQCLMNESLMIPFDKATVEPTFHVIEWRDIKLLALFKLIGRGKIDAIQQIDTPDGLYPLVSSSIENNGIVGRSNEYHFGESDEDIHYTVSTVGAPGTWFYQRGKFSAKSNILIFTLRKKFDYIKQDESVNKSFCNHLTASMQRFDYSKTLTLKEVEETVIWLPFNKITNQLDFVHAGIYDPPHWMYYIDRCINDRFI